MLEVCVVSILCGGEGRRALTWVRFDDTCPDHPKIAGLSDAAHRLWFDAMCYCNRMLTDGAVPRAMVAKIQPRQSIKAAGELVSVGLWLVNGDGFQVHDYADFQPSRAEVLGKRAAESARKKRGIPSGSGGRVIDPDPTRPVPNTRSQSQNTPLTPRKRGERIARAKAGSGRKRDREATVEAIQEVPPNPDCSRMKTSGQDCRRLVPTIQNGWCASCRA